MRADGGGADEERFADLQGLDTSTRHPIIREFRCLRPNVEQIHDLFVFKHIPYKTVVAGQPESIVTRVIVQLFCAG